ncbi:MAG: 50S ribosomal protein L6 [Armatimonadetes bacterium]|nr:50S ribosomal protein L6 [Armatimonadota bacterium]
MSRVGRKPIPIPAGVTVTVEPGNVVRVKGPKGELSFEFHPDMTIKVEDGQVVVERPSDRNTHRALHGTTRALIANMIQGVSEGYSKQLEVHGLGYRAEVRGKALVLNLGYSHEVVYEPPEGIEVTAQGTNPTVITVSGIDKQRVGQVAAEIRRLRPVEPYKGKGIRYRGEQVRLKAGKAGRVSG